LKTVVAEALVVGSAERLLAQEPILSRRTEGSTPLPGMAATWEIERGSLWTR